MRVKHYPQNVKGRDFVVGDLHGCLPAFRSLLETVSFDRHRDRVFSVGDLADRGADSLGCLALLDEPWFHAVQGNHEWMLYSVASGRLGLEQLIRNGGRWVLSDADRAAHFADHVEKLPMVIVVGQGEPGRFNVVHAEYFGTDAELDAREFPVEREMPALWGRNLISGNASGKSGVEFSVSGVAQHGLSTTYCGHTIVERASRIGSHFFIDTGSYLPQGRLTLVEPSTGRAWTASSSQEFPA